MESLSILMKEEKVVLKARASFFKWSIHQRLHGSGDPESPPTSGF